MRDVAREERYAAEPRTARASAPAVGLLAVLVSAGLTVLAHVLGLHVLV